MRRMLTRLLAAAAVLCATAVPAFGAGYATDDSGMLYQVIPDEPSIEKIGVVTVVTKTKDGKTTTERPTLTDLAISDQHGVYGISFTHLYRIHVRNPAKSQRIGALNANGFGQFNALAFDDKGRLFALEYGVLHQVDLKTGRARVLGSLGSGWGSDGDLAWLGNNLYATVNAGGTGVACHLVRIDMKTWKATDLGRIREAPRTTTKAAKGEGKKAAPKGKTKSRRLRTFDDVWGLIWDGRELYGVTPQGELIQIDHRSGRAVVVSRVRATFYGACAMLRI